MAMFSSMELKAGIKQFRVFLHISSGPIPAEFNSVSGPNSSPIDSGNSIPKWPESLDSGGIIFGGRFCPPTYNRVLCLSLFGLNPCIRPLFTPTAANDSLLPTLVGGYCSATSIKAEFDCPPWVSVEGRRLISKLLVADPARRITIPAIMRVPWFRKGLLSQPIQNNREEEEESGGEGGNNNSSSENSPSNSIPGSTKISSPKFFNAFEFISSMSSGFDLSSLFETKRWRGSIFTSRISASAIMARIEGFAKGINFRVGKVKDFKMSLVGPCEGRKGRLSVTAEVFEVGGDMQVKKEIIRKG